MNSSERNIAFEKLGLILENIGKDHPSDKKINLSLEKLRACVLNEKTHNSWFIQPFIEEALAAISAMLTRENLMKFSEKYEKEFSEKEKSNRIGVIMAGNIPLVGFHDFLCVLLAGDVFVGKLSSNDMHLLPAVADVLIAIDERFKPQIEFTNGKIEHIDKIIATGSNNSARYFEYYFAKYPSIIRKHCNSIAILNGKESKEELQKLADDICMYFGLGCRSVSKLYLPKEYDFTNLFNALDNYKPIFEAHNSYLNNLDYQKTVHLINKIPFYDQGIMMVKENQDMASPISVLHYQYYDGTETVLKDLEQKKDCIQCIACNFIEDKELIKLGQTQKPDIFNFANRIDTMQFLFS